MRQVAISRGRLSECLHLAEDEEIVILYLGEISWETEVWVADAPSHLIHFNGERFLGPYPCDAP